MNIFKSKISETETSLIKLQESYDSLNSEYEALTEALKLANEMSNTFKEEFERVTLENAELVEKLEGLNQENAEIVKEVVEVEELASLKAVEVLSQCSHPQVDIIDEAQRIEDTKFDINAFKKLTGKELQEFYNTHKKELFAALKKG